MTDTDSRLGRRSIMSGGLTAAGLAALASVSGVSTAQAAKGGDTVNDVGLLNAALALEHEGIAAYSLGAPLLTPDVLKVGLQFQGHHKEHRDALAKAITMMGGKPVAAKTNDQYAADLKASTLKTQADVLKFALGLERGAVNAYLGILGPMLRSDNRVLAGRIAADEVVHTVAFMQALGLPVPAKGFIFG